MTVQTSPRGRRPRIRLTEAEADLLSELAMQVELHNPAVAAMLIEEVDRAQIYESGGLPADVIRLGSIVEYLDENSGQRRRVSIVLPANADIEAGRISILTPTGVGLIGLSAGQSIDWPDRLGHSHRLKVLSVEQPMGQAA